jgi:hypothetical protein
VFRAGCRFKERESAGHVIGVAVIEQRRVIEQWIRRVSSVLVSRRARNANKGGQ